jgi:hypothetical protein
MPELPNKIFIDLQDLEREARHLQGLQQRNPQGEEVLKREIARRLSPVFMGNDVPQTPSPLLHLNCRLAPFEVSFFAFDTDNGWRISFHASMDDDQDVSYFFRWSGGVKRVNETTLFDNELGFLPDSPNEFNSWNEALADIFQWILRSNDLLIMALLNQNAKLRSGVKTPLFNGQP